MTGQQVVRPDGTTITVRPGLADLYRGFPGYRVQRVARDYLADLLASAPEGRP